MLKELNQIDWPFDWDWHIGLAAENLLSESKSYSRIA